MYTVAVRASDRPWMVGTAVALACGAVYVATLYPSVPGGDAGELIAVAARLGVAHPPGYPLYTVLAHLATLVPVGSLAWRVNLFSAMCAAGATGVIAATVVAVSRSAFAGAVAGALFALSPVVWTHAVGAEVFPLHELLAALLFYAAWRRSVLGVGIVTGLGLAHHQTIVFYAAPAVAWLLWLSAPADAAARRVAGLAVAIAAGLAWYLYLPLAARHATTLSWGDPTTLGGFVAHLLRRDYGTFQLLPGAGGNASSYLERLAAWGAHTLRATLAIGLVCAVFAALAASRGDDARRASWTRLLVVCLAFYVLAFHALAGVPVRDPLYRAVAARFWQQSDVVVFLLVGLGFAVIFERLPSALHPVATLAGAGVVATQLVLGFAAHDHHADDTIARYGRALLEPLAPDTLLLTRGDLVTNTVRYLQACEGVRPDVVVLDQELLTKPWYVRRAAAQFPTVRFPGTRYDPTSADGFSMRTLLDANVAAYPIAVYPDWKTGDSSTGSVYELWPMGLALAVRSAAAPPSVDDWRRESTSALAALDAYGWPPLASADPGTWEHVVLDDVWQAHHRVGWRLLDLALARDNDPELLGAARRELERAAETHPDPPWFLERNLGLVYERLALRDPTLRRAQLAAWRRYLATAPVNDDARPAIAATVARLEHEGATR